MWESDKQEAKMKFRLRWTEEWESEFEADSAEEAVEQWEVNRHGENTWLLEEGKPKVQRLKSSLTEI